MNISAYSSCPTSAVDTICPCLFTMRIAARGSGPSTTLVGSVVCGMLLEQWWDFYFALGNFIDKFAKCEWKFLSQICRLNCPVWNRLYWRLKAMFRRQKPCEANKLFNVAERPLRLNNKTYFRHSASLTCYKSQIHTAPSKTGKFECSFKHI